MVNCGISDISPTYPGYSLFQSFIQVLDIELCGSDQILIKDGDSILSQTIATLTSGSTSGQVIMSTRNGMFILMSLHEHLSCRGVLLSYREGKTFYV